MGYDPPGKTRIEDFADRSIDAAKKMVVEEAIDEMHKHLRELKSAVRILEDNTAKYYVPDDVQKQVRYGLEGTLKIVAKLRSFLTPHNKHLEALLNEFHEHLMVPPGDEEE